MLTLFRKEKVFTYTEAQVKEMAKGIETLFNEALVAKGQVTKCMNALSFSVELLGRIRECYPAVFEECITHEDIDKLSDL